MLHQFFNFGPNNVPFTYRQLPFHSRFHGTLIEDLTALILSRKGIFTNACIMSDAGIQALDAAQDELKRCLAPYILDDPLYPQYAGHMQCELMLSYDYEVDRMAVPLPPQRQIVFKNAAIYRRMLRCAA